MTDAETGWSDCLQHAVVTDIGMRRSNNQDAYSIILASDDASWQDRGHIFVVADGMGAHAAGELASRLAVDGIPHTYYRYRDKSPPEAILRAVRETNGQINSRGQANTDFHNMGTTASVLLLLPQGALAAHVGDSRIYRLRGDQLEQLTFDHSLLWEMRAAGQVPKGDSDITSMIPKNVITRWVRTRRSKSIWKGLCPSNWMTYFFSAVTALRERFRTKNWAQFSVVLNHSWRPKYL